MNKEYSARFCNTCGKIDDRTKQGGSLCQGCSEGESDKNNKLQNHSMDELYEMLKAIVNERYRRLEKDWKSITTIPPDSKKVYIRLFGQYGVKGIGQYISGKWYVVDYDFVTAEDSHGYVKKEFLTEIEEKYRQNAKDVEWHEVEKNSPWPLHVNLAVHCIKEMTAK